LEPESVLVQVGDLALHYVDWGKNGPPLLLMHGGRRNYRSWDPIAHQLRQDYWVIALDAKGHNVNVFL
jgi:pimeloyl-ACP methyl ester carboxylesterase